MKINNLLFAAVFFFTITSNAQITKGNWMMGGNGSLGSYETTSLGTNNRGTFFNFNPNMGYFFMDKLAIGATARLNVHSKFSTNIEFGPFIRYYFLEKEKTLNIFSEVNYNVMRGTGDGDVKFDTFNVKVGSVYFLNSSIGLEVALNYLNKKSNLDYKSNDIFLGVGFQIHLEKK